MIHVVAIITTKPGKRAEVLEAFHANIPAVRAEKGCVEYGPVIDAPDMGPIQTAVGDDTFVVIEKWATKEDLKAHAAAADGHHALGLHEGTATHLDHEALPASAWRAAHGARYPEPAALVLDFARFIAASDDAGAA